MFYATLRNGYRARPRAGMRWRTSALRVTRAETSEARSSALRATRAMSAHAQCAGAQRYPGSIVTPRSGSAQTAGEATIVVW